MKFRVQENGERCKRKISSNIKITRNGEKITFIHLLTFINSLKILLLLPEIHTTFWTFSAHEIMCFYFISQFQSAKVFLSDKWGCGELEESLSGIAILLGFWLQLSLPSLSNNVKNFIRNFFFRIFLWSERWKASGCIIFAQITYFFRSSRTAKWIIKIVWSPLNSKKKLLGLKDAICYFTPFMPNFHWP